MLKFRASNFLSGSILFYPQSRRPALLVGRDEMITAILIVWIPSPEGVKYFTPSGLGKIIVNRSL
jgi:hypothetical protein